MKNKLMKFEDYSGISTGAGEYRQSDFSNASPGADYEGDVEEMEDMDMSDDVDDSLVDNIEDLVSRFGLGKVKSVINKMLM